MSEELLMEQVRCVVLFCKSAAAMNLFIHVHELC